MNTLLILLTTTPSPLQVFLFLGLTTLVVGLHTYKVTQRTKRDTKKEIFKKLLENGEINEKTYIKWTKNL